MCCWPANSILRKRRFTSRKSHQLWSSAVQHTGRFLRINTHEKHGGAGCYGSPASLLLSRISTRKEVGQTFASVAHADISLDLVPAGSGRTGNEPARASAVKSSGVAPAVLLFVGDHDVVDGMPLRVLALEGRSARFSVLGALRGHDHRHLAALLHRGLDCVGINSLYRDGVRIADAGNRVVLTV